MGCSAGFRRDRDPPVSVPPVSNGKDNVRVGVDSTEMPIPSTDSVASNSRSERESHHGMLIDADSPASSTAAASLL
jgi:hypothetical protein